MFKERFPNELACLKFLFYKRCGTNYICPKCGHDKFSKVKGRKCFQCSGACGHHIYPMAGTIFGGSTTPLLDWFEIIYEFCSTSNGVSAKKIERDYNVTYKCAWRIANKIRSLMDDPDIKLSGKVEIDATYIGGKKNKNKEVIFGMIERGKNGKAKAYVVEQEDRKNIMPLVLKHIEKGSIIYSDDHGAYKNILKENGYEHYTISHRQKIYVVDDHIHTCTIDNFWGKFKDGIRGSYKRLNGKHLQSYINECAFRRSRNHDRMILFDHLLDKACQTIDK